MTKGYTMKHTWEYKKPISIKISADVIGPLAVHPNFNPSHPDEWTITHIKTGLRLGPTFSTVQEAHHAAEMLSEKDVWDFSVIKPTTKFRAAGEWAKAVFCRLGLLDAQQR